MNRTLSFLIVFTAFTVLSCKNPKKEKEVEPQLSQKEEKRDLNEFLVFENLLMKDDIENAEYKNITFTKEGALFTKVQPTYIKIPFSDLNLSQGFNLSFSFTTTDDDGRKPQSLIAFVDQYSSPSRIPFYVYYPGNRISGVNGKQALWAEDYNPANGYSRSYYDSFKLSKDRFYFISVNVTETKVNIFVNTELYASFEGLTPHDYKVENISIGALVSNENVTYPFAGNIHGLKIFNRPLEETEIVKVFNGQPVINGVEY